MSSEGKSGAAGGVRGSDGLALAEEGLAGSGSSDGVRRSRRPAGLSSKRGGRRRGHGLRRLDVGESKPEPTLTRGSASSGVVDAKAEPYSAPSPQIQRMADSNPALRRALGMRYSGLSRNASGGSGARRKWGAIRNHVMQEGRGEAATTAAKVIRGFADIAENEAELSRIAGMVASRASDVSSDTTESAMVNPFDELLIGSGITSEMQSEILSEKSLFTDEVRSAAQEKMAGKLDILADGLMVGIDPKGYIVVYFNESNLHILQTYIKFNKAKIKASEERVEVAGCGPCSRVRIAQTERFDGISLEEFIKSIYFDSVRSALPYSDILENLLRCDIESEWPDDERFPQELMTSELMRHMRIVISGNIESKRVVVSESGSETMFSRFDLSNLIVGNLALRGKFTNVDFSHSQIGRLTIESKLTHVKFDGSVFGVAAVFGEDYEQEIHYSSFNNVAVVEYVLFKSVEHRGGKFDFNPNARIYVSGVGNVNQITGLVIESREVSESDGVFTLNHAEGETAHPTISLRQEEDVLSGVVSCRNVDVSGLEEMVAGIIDAARRSSYAISAPPSELRGYSAMQFLMPYGGGSRLSSARRSRLLPPSRRAQVGARAPSTNRDARGGFSDHPATGGVLSGVVDGFVTTSSSDDTAAAVPVPSSMAVSARRSRTLGDIGGSRASAGVIARGEVSAVTAATSASDDGGVDGAGESKGDDRGVSEQRRAIRRPSDMAVGFDHYNELLDSLIGDVGLRRERRGRPKRMTPISGSGILVTGHSRAITQSGPPILGSRVSSSLSRASVFSTDPSDIRVFTHIADPNVSVVSLRTSKVLEIYGKLKRINTKREKNNVGEAGCPYSQEDLDASNKSFREFVEYLVRNNPQYAEYKAILRDKVMVNLTELGMIVPFSGEKLDMSGFDLSHCNLEGVIINGNLVTCKKVNLKGANLTNVKFANIDLTNFIVSPDTIRDPIPASIAQKFNIANVLVEEDSGRDTPPDYGAANSRNMQKKLVLFDPKDVGYSIISLVSPSLTNAEEAGRGQVIAAATAGMVVSFASLALGASLLTSSALGGIGGLGVDRAINAAKHKEALDGSYGWLSESLAGIAKAERNVITNLYRLIDKFPASRRGAPAMMTRQQLAKFVAEEVSKGNYHPVLPIVQSRADEVRGEKIIAASFASLLFTSLLLSRNQTLLMSFVYSVMSYGGLRVLGSGARYASRKGKGTFDTRDAFGDLLRYIGIAWGEVVSVEFIKSIMTLIVANKLIDDRTIKAALNSGAAVTAANAANRAVLLGRKLRQSPTENEQKIKSHVDILERNKLLAGAIYIAIPTLIVGGVSMAFIPSLVWGLAVTGAVGSIASAITFFKIDSMNRFLLGPLTWVIDKWTGLTFCCSRESRSQFENRITDELFAEQNKILLDEVANLIEYIEYRAHNSLEIPAYAMTRLAQYGKIFNESGLDQDNNYSSRVRRVVNRIIVMGSRRDYNANRTKTEAVLKTFKSIAKSERDPESLSAAVAGFYLNAAKALQDAAITRVKETGRSIMGAVTSRASSAVGWLGGLVPSFLKSKTAVTADEELAPDAAGEEKADIISSSDEEEVMPRVSEIIRRFRESLSAVEQPISREQANNEANLLVVQAHNRYKNLMNELEDKSVLLEQAPMIERLFQIRKKEAILRGESLSRNQLKAEERKIQHEVLSNVKTNTLQQYYDNEISRVEKIESSFHELNYMRSLGVRSSRGITFTDSDDRKRVFATVCHYELQGGLERFMESQRRSMPRRLTSVAVADDGERKHSRLQDGGLSPRGAHYDRAGAGYGSVVGGSSEESDDGAGVLPASMRSEHHGEGKPSRPSHGHLSPTGAYYDRAGAGRGSEDEGGYATDVDDSSGRGAQKSSGRALRHSRVASEDEQMASPDDAIVAMPTSRRIEHMVRVGSDDDAKAEVGEVIVHVGSNRSVSTSGSDASRKCTEESTKITLQRLSGDISQEAMEAAMAAANIHYELRKRKQRIAAARRAGGDSGDDLEDDDITLRRVDVQRRFIKELKAIADARESWIETMPDPAEAEAKQEEVVVHVGATPGVVSVDPRDMPGGGCSIM